MNTKYILPLFFLFVSLQAADLKEKLEAKFGNYHFEFIGSKYAFRIDTKGIMTITSKDGSTDRTSLEPYFLQYVSRALNKNDFKEYDIVELKTSQKVKSSSFTLVMNGVMENGAVFTSKIQGSKTKMIISTQVDKMDPKFYYRIRFMMPEAKQDMLGGVLARKVGKNLIQHKCKDVYDKSNYKPECQAIVIKKRLVNDSTFETIKSEGLLRAAQHSHNEGSILNKPFSVAYINQEPKWVASKNTFSISF